MNAVVIELSQGFVAIISEEDFIRVSQYSWHVHRSKGTRKEPGQPYARATVDGKKVYLHRFIMDAPYDKQVDHKNHQTLDNRRENLKIVCHKENLRNRRRVGRPRKNKLEEK